MTEPEAELIHDAGHLLFQVQKEAIERLFPKGWLAASASAEHPAALRWELCRQMIAQNGTIRLPHQEHQLPVLGRVVLDAFLLSQIGGNDWLGSLNEFGDERVQSKLKSRIRNPEQFEDLMLELAVAGWYLSKGLSVQPSEEPGFPDLRISTVGADVPLHAECKRLSSITRNRLITEVRDANRQLRHPAEPHCGIALFDLSGALGLVKAPPWYVPPEVEEAQSIVAAALRGAKNRAVGAVFLTWDTCHEIIEQSGLVLLFFSRAKRVVHHELVEGLRPIPQGITLFDGTTVILISVVNGENRPKRRFLSQPTLTKRSPNASALRTRRSPRSAEADGRSSECARVRATAVAGPQLSFALGRPGHPRDAGRRRGVSWRHPSAARGRPMSDATAKQLALRALEQLPEDATLEDAMERLYLLERIERGRADVRAGRVVAHEEVVARFGLR